MSMSRLSLAFDFLLLSLSFASSPVFSQPAGSLALVCRTGNNFISYYGYTYPSSPMLQVGFKHDETAYSMIKPANLGAGNCTFTTRAMLSYEPFWLYYSVNNSNSQNFEVAVTNIRLPRTVNQVMFIGGDTAAKSMFALGATTGELVGLYVVPVAIPVNYAYKVVGTFTPSQFLPPIDRIDPLPIKTTLARTTAADYSDLSAEQIEAEEARAQYEAGLADTSSSSSNGGNNNMVYIAVGSAIGGLALGMILTLIAISYRARRHSQKHVTRIEMTNTEHQHQLTANPAVVHVNQL